MDIYNAYLNEDLSKMNNEDFLDLLKKFEMESKEISVDAQRKIRKLLNIEAERRKIDNAKLDNLMNEKIGLEKDLQAAQELLEQKGFEANFYDQNKIDKFIVEKKNEIAEKEKEIEQMRLQKSASKRAFSAARKVKFSIIYKRIDNSKKAISSAPQTICTLSKKKLNAIYNNAKKLYHKVDDALSSRSTEVETALDDLFEESNDVYNDVNLSNAQKFIQNQDIVKEQKKLYKKYKRIEKARGLLVNMKNGVQKQMTVPSEKLKRFFEKRKEAKVEQPSSITI